MPENSVKVAFLGTGQFAVPSLEALADSGYDLRLVVTQPDRPSGRGRTTRPNPVAAAARRLPLAQPVHVMEALPALQEAGVELLVVAAYGQILPKDILMAALCGALNVHASLLPAYRGASPVQQALLDGVDETGVTIIQMDQGVDTGPIVSQRPVQVAPDETAGALEQRLADVGADLLLETLPKYLAGRLSPRPQPPEGASSTRQLRKQDGRIDWTQPAAYIERHVRAMQPWPGAWTESGGTIVKILSLAPTDGPNLRPGEVAAETKVLHVGTGSRPVKVRRLQFPGKRPVDAAAAIAGYAGRLRRFS